MLGRLFTLYLKLVLLKIVNTVNTIRVSAGVPDQVFWIKYVILYLFVFLSLNFVK